MNIVSWNTRGNYKERLSTFSGKLLDKSDNIILIQEAGPVDFYKTPFEVKLGEHSFCAYFCEHENAKNLRCTTGMLVENSFGAKTFHRFDSTKDTSNGQREGRPIVAVEFNDNNLGVVVIATAHLTACERLASDELVRMNELFRSLYNPSNENLKWLIMGDFNCQADKIGNLNNFWDMNYSFSEIATHESGKSFDFAIYSDSLKGIDVKTGLPNDPDYVPTLSDHFPIYCSI